VSVTVQLPPLLRGLVGGEKWLTAEGPSVAAVLADLAKRHPALGLHFFDEQRAVRRNIIVLHGGDVVRAGETDARRVADGDEIVLTNALAGG
jgi:molybdopterin converting factor small subunit